MPQKVGKEALKEAKQIKKIKLHGSKDETGINELDDDALYGE